MKAFALAAVVAAGTLLTSGTADAQFFRGGGFGGGSGGGYGRGYNSFPGYGYSNPGYGYSGRSNWGYGYSGPGYSSYSYPGYSNPSYYSAPGYYGSGVVTGGYTPTDGTGTVVASGYTPADTPAAPGGYYGPAGEGASYTYPGGYASYPSSSCGCYSYPMYSGGRSSRGLFGMRR